MTQQSELNLQGIDFEEGYIAVIDKPLEWTSSDVVRKIKFALRRAGYPKIKVGHAGVRCNPRWSEGLGSRHELRSVQERCCNAALWQR